MALPHRESPDVTQLDPLLDGTAQGWLAVGSTQRGRLHRVAWASLQNGGWGSRLRVPKRQEGEVTSFIAWVEKLDNRPPVLCRPINGDSRARGPDSTSQRKER